MTNVEPSKTISQADGNGDDKREEYGNESYGIQDHPDTDKASLNTPSIANQVRVSPTPYNNNIANGDNTNVPDTNDSAETQYDSPTNEAQKSNGKGKSAGAASSATGSTTGSTKTSPGKSESTGKADKSNGKGKSAGAASSATGSTTGSTKTSPGKSESTGKADKSNGKGKSAGAASSATGSTTGSTKTSPGKSESTGKADKSNGKGKSAGAASSATGSTTGSTKTSPGKSESTGKADKSNGKSKSAGAASSAGGVTDTYGGNEEATALIGLRGSSKRGGGEDDEKISSVSSGKGNSGSSTSNKQTSNTNPPSHSNKGKPGDKLTKLEAMSIETMDAATQDAKQYVRGDPTTTGIDYQDGSSIFNEGGDGNSPLVIGGRKRGWQTEAQTGLYAVSSGFQNGLRFSVCAAALISVLLLLAFHFEVLNEGIARYLPSGSLWAPNSWEFIVYTQYVQQIAGISALTLLKTPYFLWDFTDLFAWANFLVYHAQDEYSSSGRRLMAVILGGLVGYGDRIETDEKKLLTHTCTGFAVVMGFFLGVVLGASLWSKWRERRNENARRGVVWRCLGLVLLVWFFSLLPLSMVVSFEVSMELKAHTLQLWPLSISFAVVVVVILGVIVVVTRSILHSDERDLSKLRSRAIWGAFYSHCTYGGRIFFLLMVALQISMGLCLGVLDDSAMALTLLIGLHVLFFVAMFIVKPFPSSSSRAKFATYAVTVLKVANFALAFAFLPSSTLSVAGLSRVANAFIGVNSCVILGWCLRHLVMFWKLAIASAKLEMDNRIARDTETGIGAPPSIALSELVLTKPREYQH
ncbi:hypothetical protein PR002_g1407 [Phytophthora rubi]|uniref:TRP C-terminal domain-containing protein n=1 Tax=Phytophthora rubi TaxID=129364 RepID=A0A6A3NUW0_9STRA|nr:hypothetical protein PR002_g1407 [Phytophthora rubi]